ncbi:MAG: pyridoxal phosphate-dependent aminotransferase [Gammaproteobacteria bacterium]|uniref:pyridoxal phosphate-dependent aminotransferase n=1 Tax=Rhodoferax sp. TaxID=50421 RepID=UPI0017AB0E0A|nr:pyridoxal phosphate-dependent aminotransferase [Rhodoferax sp.]MBU3899140.1 pyridoxal phosphate-dependent aminotransferase [Gammaproteobacteria bacterium]MBA3059983.1 pyridoxal phosphate-dependent aminotransferase [Rhodoferax sp.]MBU3996639.1 pyridoxal phosphate-dependent aminotransferase [Gammaproteobacteria bacterium]MBU4018585.1 pyridoxal phosphate-dependent aminotransferase [Gammaproteobacteria bacterium]MBU4080597.1 pyridoxal phosphate-dependent aminotransferase [Gammaproteobacteria ba
MKISGRAQRIEPFYVMEVAKAASKLALDVANSATPMIFLNIGEPDFTAPPLVQDAACRAVHDGLTHYTQATGMGPLRERISDWYLNRFNVQVPTSRIVITAGASAALQLACLALVESGDEILMPDPSYPCNRHFVAAADGTAVLIPTTAAERFQLSADKVQAAWGPKTRGVLLASPSNPTGTSIAPSELRRIHQVVSQQGGITLVDEIYLGLSFDPQYGQTALALDDNIISINSFSKYFNMTGWRLGWMVVPEQLVPVIERLAQNLFICPSAIAQHAALACFEPSSLLEYERRRLAFKARRDYFIPALNALGLTVPVMPDGAFYAWADCSNACRTRTIKDSWDLAFDLMQHAHVAVTPGRDFGQADVHNFIRFSTASSMAQLHEAVARLKAYLEPLK